MQSMIASTITIRAPRAEVTALADDGAVLARAFGSAANECRFAYLAAPGGRGTEIHASSAKTDEKQLKAALRRFRSIVETGEIPTGSRNAEGQG